MLGNPSTIAEVAWDGLIDRADVDANFYANLGPVRSREFNENSTGITARFELDGRPDATIATEQIAEIRSGLLTWTSQRIAAAADAFGIPELRGEQPWHPVLRDAARTIYGNLPTCEIPFKDRTVLVALQVPVHRSRPELAILRGAAQGIPEARIERCLAAYAAARGLADTPRVTVRDGRIYDVPGQLSLDDVRADAHYLALEHRLFFEATFPGATTYFDRSTGIATLNFPYRPALACRAIMLSVIRGDEWRWASSVPEYAHSPATVPLRQLQRFGETNGIPAFATANLPLHLAQQWDVIDAAKPVLGMWTNTFAPLGPDTYAALLIDHPALQLPAPRPDVQRAITQRALPEPLSRERALATYARFRGC